MTFKEICVQSEKANVETYGSEISYKNKISVSTVVKAFPEDAEYSIISRDGSRIYDAKTFLSVVLVAKPVRGETIEIDGEIWDVDNWKSGGTGIYDIYCTKDEKSTNRRTKRQS